MNNRRLNKVWPQQPQQTPARVESRKPVEPEVKETVSQRKSEEKPAAKPAQAEVKVAAAKTEVSEELKKKQMNLGRKFILYSKEKIFRNNFWIN